MSDETRAPDPTVCTCTPCEYPAYGIPGYSHCTACCAGSLIEEYDHGCPVDDHAEMAELQFPLARQW